MKHSPFNQSKISGEYSQGTPTPNLETMRQMRETHNTDSSPVEQEHENNRWQPCRTAVLLVCFNRPEPTRRVFNAIHSAQPQRLYIAVDGPRNGHPSDADNVRQVKEVIADIDWPCRVRRRYQERNLGCGNGVSDAISWFFLHESEGIILEDDCLPSPDFFPFCEELLHRYRHAEEVEAISGFNPLSSHDQHEYSYYFSRYFQMWGWATWRRAWNHFDKEMCAWPTLRRSGFFNSFFERDFLAAWCWTRTMDCTYRGEIDTWDYQWMLSIWAHGGLTAIPAENLVTNLGFGSDATHTLNSEHTMARLTGENMDFPLRHPDRIASCKDIDRKIARLRFNVTPFQILKTVVGDRIPWAVYLWQKIRGKSSRSPGSVENQIRPNTQVDRPPGP